MRKHDKLGLLHKRGKPRHRLSQEPGFKAAGGKGPSVLPQVTGVGQEGRQGGQRKVRALVEMPAPADARSFRVPLGGESFGG